MSKYIDVFTREMKNRNYSVRTVKLYSSYLSRFLEFSAGSSLSPGERIAEFLDKKLSSHEQRRLAWSSIKLFYKLVIRKECPYELSRIRSRHRLPDILSREEIVMLLKGINNLNHRLMISMLYGSGLRVSEVCSIRIKDLDFIHMKLRIRDSKGHKDRVTLLSESLKDDLKEIIRDRSADEFLFVTILGSKYSIRTVQKIFSDAYLRSGMNKKPTCHTLRHSFATHLVENGTDVKTVKSLLGHKSIKTTMVYVKLADPLTRDLKSPL